MSLVPDYDDSLSDSSEDQSQSSPEPESSAPKVKLPAPDFKGVLADPETLKSSVFKNAFTEAENAKEAILQKHVKMVDTQDNVVVINGKKICWNYRKGRCRFGHNCKYAHDSDIQKTPEQLQIERQPKRRGNCQSDNLPQPTGDDVKHIQQDSVLTQKRKRPGLTQGLVPGKKVMKRYLNQK